MKKLIVCTDGSGYSNVCCQFASWLAAKAEASADVLYVTDIRQYEMPIVADISGSLGAQPYMNLVSQLQEVEKLRTQAVEEGAKKTFSEQGDGIEPGFMHKEGTLVDKLESLQDDYDMILIGKRGMNSEAAKEHLGSSLERVVRACHKPVLVTSRAFRPINKVLIAYDGEASSKRVLDFVSTEPFFKSASLNVICVDDKEQEKADKLASEAANILANAGLECTKMTCLGNAHECISNAAEEIKADLLAIGAFGKNRIREFFIGSTTAELLRTKNMPLLCMR